MRKEPAVLETIEECLCGGSGKCKGAQSLGAWLVQGKERKLPLWLRERD